MCFRSVGGLVSPAPHHVSGTLKVALSSASQTVNFSEGALSDILSSARAGGVPISFE